MAWPISLAQLGLPLMGIVDSAVVGRVSVADLAGAAMGRTLGFAAFMLALGVSMALEPLASQAVGAREPERAWEMMRTTMRAVLLLWAPLMACALGVTYLLEPFGVEHDVALRTRDYFLGSAPGYALFGGFSVMKVFLQAHGQTRPALVGVFIANVLNLVICNVLVRGDDLLLTLHLPPCGLPRLGAFGAGLASSLASLVLVSIVYRAARAYRPREAAPKVAMRRVLSVGTPIGLQMLAEFGVFALATMIAGRLGKEIVAAHQAAIGLASVTYMAALGVSGATAVRVGHAVGAAQSPRRAGVMGMAVGALVMCVPALLFIAIPKPLVMFFTKDEGVITLGMALLRIAGVFQLFDGVQAVAGGALRGAGDVRFSFYANLTAYWAIGLPLALVLAFPLKWGAQGIWWGLTLGLILVAFALVMRFLRLSKTALVRV